MKTATFFVLALLVAVCSAGWVSVTTNPAKSMGADPSTNPQRSSESVELYGLAEAVAADELRRRRLEAGETVDENARNLIAVGMYPTSWSQTASCQDSVSNQGSCGNCYAHATTSAVHDVICHKGGGNVNTHAYQATACYDCDAMWGLDCSANWGIDGGCCGGDALGVYEYYMNEGANTDSAVTSCISYNSGCSGSWNCNQGCLDNSYSYNLDGWYAIGWDPDTWADLGLTDAEFRDEIKDALIAYGAVTSTMYTYNNFFDDDVNHWDCDSATLGAYEGMHMMKFVGWTGTKWDIQNSWGTGWGNSGYYTTPMTQSGSCNMHTAVTADFPAVPVYYPNVWTDWGSCLTAYANYIDDLIDTVAWNNDGAWWRRTEVKAPRRGLRIAFDC